MSKLWNHPYHLVDPSPWPILGAIRTFTLLRGLAKWFNQYSLNLLIVGIIISLITIYQWWRDISREGTFQGLHTSKVQMGLKLGIILFIVSEIFFFFLSFEDFSISVYRLE